MESEAMKPRIETSDDGRDMTEIRNSASTGNGLFASRDIPRGTRILAEVPLLSIPTTNEDPDDDIPEFCQALQQLPVTERTELDKLGCWADHNTSERRLKVRQWYKDNILMDSNGQRLKGKKLQDVSKATTKRFAIFLTNRVQMGLDAEYGTGVFSKYSRINHSCVANVHNAYNPDLQRLTVHAVCGIKAGDEITVNYLGKSGYMTAQMVEPQTKKNWGFVCTCPACTDPAIDDARQRMLQLDQALGAFEFLRGLDIGPHSPFRPPTPPGMRSPPASARKALQDALQLAELQEKHDLVGWVLCKTYRACSNYSFEAGSIEQAIYYARKELDIERCCIGTETQHMREDIQGAEYWLAHLEHLGGGAQS